MVGMEVIARRPMTILILVYIGVYRVRVGFQQWMILFYIYRCQWAMTSLQVDNHGTVRYGFIFFFLNGNYVLFMVLPV